MDPHVYPEGLNPAKNIVRGASFTSAVEQLVVSDTMFIRVAMSTTDCVSLAGAVAPTLSLQADTGDFVDLVATTRSIFKLPGSSLADYVADAKVDVDPAFSNVFKITILFFPPTTPHTWNLRILNNDGAAGSTRDFTWVASGTEANTIQPWINVQPANLTLKALINTSLSDSVQVMNKGTGPLVVSAVAPAFPAGSGLTLGALPASISPGLKRPLTVSFSAGATPAVTVNADETVTSSTNDDTLASSTAVGHNNLFKVSSTSRELEIVLLLDDSGSMSWTPNGDPLSAGSPISRYAELVNAITQFLPMLGHFGFDAVHSVAKGQFGIARFPPGNAIDPTTYDILGMCPIVSSADMISPTGPVHQVSIISPVGGTPMGDGIEHVFKAPFEYFRDDVASINANLRWLLLMTDGAHNAGTHDPYEYIHATTINGETHGTAGPGTSLADKKVNMFAIGYGMRGHSDVNEAMLKFLSAGSLQPASTVRRADDDHFSAPDLAAAFRDAIKNGISTPSPSDPRDVFIYGAGGKRHAITITPYDKNSAFVLNWNTPNANRLRLELLTPNCELITPENAGRQGFEGILFHGGDRFNMYMIDAEFLHNKADPSQPRFGAWTMIISSPIIFEARIGNVAAAFQDHEIYDYDVLVDSDLRLDLSMDQAVYYNGDPIKVTAKLTATGLPIPGATVSLSTTAPDQSEANWITGLTVPARAMRKAQEFLKGQDSTDLLVKKVAAGFAGFTFDPQILQSVWPMTDPSQIGVYQATFRNTSNIDKVTLYVTATGITEDGVSFRREGKLFTPILVRPDPLFTLFDIQFLQMGAAIVRIVPRDKFGNRVADPAGSVGINVVSKGKVEFAGPLINNLDGSYTRQLKFDPNTKPVISLAFGGKSLMTVNIPPVGNLVWVNQVLKYRPGVEAARGANQHTKPEAVLGSPFARTDEGYVSLGGRGQLIVALEKMTILPSGGDDITVFVHPAAELRAYRVDVFVPNMKQDDDTKNTDPASKKPAGWVSLGISKGGTQSFSLTRMKVPAAAAIRISDLSGQTREQNGEPSDSPGMSAQAVGVQKVTDKTPWDDDWFKKLQDKNDD